MLALLAIAKRHQKWSWVLTDYEVSRMAFVICHLLENTDSRQGAKTNMQKTSQSLSWQLIFFPTWVVQVDHVLCIWH